MRALWLVVLVACASGPRDRTAPPWWRGAWKLEWVKIKDAAPTLTRVVRDVQTPTVFGSVRIPLDRPAFPNAKSFADLDDTQLQVLLEQRGGFAGTSSFEGHVAAWTHEIDFQPINSADTARLERLGPSTALEVGLDGGFSELWWSMSSGDGKYLGIKIANGSRTERMLVVVGDHFVYARNRKRDLPPGASLSAIAAGKSRDEVVEMLDCELSYGIVRGGRVPWEIRFSTLPWREGQPLAFASEVVVNGSGPAPRTPTPGWSVPMNTFTRDDLRLMFAAAK